VPAVFRTVLHQARNHDQWTQGLRVPTEHSFTSPLFTFPIHPASHLLRGALPGLLRLVLALLLQLPGRTARTLRAATSIR
jgi:hypothetical protein